MEEKPPGNRKMHRNTIRLHKMMKRMEGRAIHPTKGTRVNKRTRAEEESRALRKEILKNHEPAKPPTSIYERIQR